MGLASSRQPEDLRGPVAGFFEGTEKRVEIDFSSTASADARGLRAIPESAWNEVIRLAGTQALFKKETPEADSFLLSESSLIVYADKVLLKTCGRTVPLNGVAKIFELAESVGMEREWMGYSRKNFLDTSQQPPQHRTVEDEIATCTAVSSCGHGYVLGPCNADHWLLYNADFKDVDGRFRNDYTVDIMMYDLPADVRQHFYTDAPEGCPAGAAAMADNSGLTAVAKEFHADAAVYDYCFAPCGYSSNIHAGGSYAVIHVTPEESCSYASFETNLGASVRGEPLEDLGARVDALIAKVLAVFKPGKFTMSLFADQGVKDKLAQAPFSAVPRASYKRLGLSLCSFENDYEDTAHPHWASTMANYVLRGSHITPTSS
eukprot:TRINITY_DN65395_c0_g1_i1.p1 TRINITY_DN65395_c0_g1~~TRINITY_DN65395_c0_g1_i1.p1  ORF type:complete len:414 (-),score=70.51 TRINITY_DN65395_c0_g1_i1:145-1269(-)